MMAFGEEFLRNPNLFPAEGSGDSWGPLKICINSIGGTYEVTGLSEAQHGSLTRVFGTVLEVEDRVSKIEDRVSKIEDRVSKIEDRVEIRVFRAEREDFAPLPHEFFEYRLDLRHGDGTLAIAGAQFMGLLEWRGRLSASLWTCRDADESFREVCENMLRALMAYRLLGGGRILLHCASFVERGGGGAFVFPGCSGAGKSTLSGLASRQGYRVLSDELNVLWREGSALRVAQVPFAGDFGPAEVISGSFEVKAICRLRQALADVLQPISPAELMGLLYSSAPFVNVDPGRQQLLDQSLDLMVAAGCPAYELGFSLGSQLEVLASLASKEPVH